MKEKLEEAITIYREEINGSITFPSQKHILEVNKHAKQLDEYKVTFFA